MTNLGMIFLCHSVRHLNHFELEIRKYNWEKCTPIKTTFNLNGPRKVYFIPKIVRTGT